MADLWVKKKLNKPYATFLPGLSHLQEEKNSFRHEIGHPSGEPHPLDHLSQSDVPLVMKKFRIEPGLTQPRQGSPAAHGQRPVGIDHEAGITVFDAALFIHE